jgi:hypothetical protein
MARIEHLVRVKAGFDGRNVKHSPICPGVKDWEDKSPWTSKVGHRMAGESARVYCYLKFISKAGFKQTSEVQRAGITNECASSNGPLLWPVQLPDHGTMGPWDHRTMGPPTFVLHGFFNMFWGSYGPMVLWSVSGE